MAVLCINLSGSNAVIRDINRAKDELENILKDLNKAQDNISNSIYINGLSSYRSSIESEKLSVQRDIQKLVDFNKAYKSFLENAERIDKQYAKIISNAGYDYRNETGLIKEEWKKSGKLIIGTLVIAGTVAAAVFIGGPVLIGAAVGATVSAAIGAGAGYLTGGAEGAIDGFFYGSISGAITGAVGGLVAGPPPALGSAPREVLKYMAKQSIADGVGEGLAGGTVGYMKGGTEGAVAGGVSGLVSGTVTGLISGGISYKAQGLPQKIINKFKEGKVNADININTKGVSKAGKNIIDIITENGLTVNKFNEIRIKDTALLTDTEKLAMKSIRDSISMPDNMTTMQKVIPNNDISKYLDGSYTQVGGYVTKYDDVYNLNKYNDIYESLRLDYPGTAYKVDSDSSLGVIRFKTPEAEKFEIPYGVDFGGTITDAPPFTGNGFTKAMNDNVIPEYKCNSFLEVYDGAELYKIDKNGIETLIAVFNEIDGRFVLIK